MKSKKIKRIIFRFGFLVGVLSLLSGCSGMLDSLREESEEAEREAQREEAFNNLSEKPRRARGLSANSTESYGSPSQRRRKNNFDDDGFDSRAAAIRERNESDPDAAEPEIRPERRRYSRSDFVDGNTAENSLWNSQGQNNFYFSQNNRFDNGDLVIINVDRALKREIQYALWKSLPAEQRRIQKKRSPASGDGKGDDAAKKKAAEQATAKSSEQDERDAAEEAAKSSLGAEKDGDLIRMEIVENLGNGLVRLMGEKRVIYRGRPKFVEVSALVRGNEIDGQSRANSKSFLDMRTRVIQ
jgi:hypothetical protein